MKFLRLLAAPLAPLYGAVVRARNRPFDRDASRIAHLDLPVVSVGNLTLGGTGKTPLTLFLAESLQEAGLRSMILSRGYGGRRPFDPMDVLPDSDPAQVGDEPLMMARRLGPGRVVVGRKRLHAGLRGQSADPRPEVFLLDDGFQHRALHRDLDLLILDGVRRWGNGRMVPLGDLREPFSSVRRAHALVVTRGARADRKAILAWWQEHGSGGPVFWVDFAIHALREATSGQRLHAPFALDPGLAFCALGHPQAFFADLLVAGLPWVGTAAFRDHQALRPDQLATLARQAQAEGAAHLLCTEKDAVKFGPHHLQACPLPLWIAEQRVVGGEALAAFVLERVKACRVP